MLSAHKKGGILNQEENNLVFSRFRTEKEETTTKMYN